MGIENWEPGGGRILPRVFPQKKRKKGWVGKMPRWPEKKAKETVVNEPPVVETLAANKPERLNIFISKIAKEHKIMLRPAIEIVTGAGLQTQTPALIIQFSGYRWVPKRTNGVDAHEIVALLRAHERYGVDFKEVMPQKIVVGARDMIVDKTCPYCAKPLRYQSQYEEHVGLCTKKTGERDVEVRVSEEQNIGPSLPKTKDGVPIDLKKVRELAKHGERRQAVAVDIAGDTKPEQGE